MALWLTIAWPGRSSIKSVSINLHFWSSLIIYSKTKKRFAWGVRFLVVVARMWKWIINVRVKRRRKAGSIIGHVLTRGEGVRCASLSNWDMESHGEKMFPVKRDLKRTLAVSNEAKIVMKPFFVLRHVARRLKRMSLKNEMWKLFFASLVTQIASIYVCLRTSSCEWWQVEFFLQHEKVRFGRKIYANWCEFSDSANNLIKLFHWHPKLWDQKHSCH